MKFTSILRNAFLLGVLAASPAVAQSDEAKIRKRAHETAFACLRDALPSGVFNFGGQCILKAHDEFQMSDKDGYLLSLSIYRTVTNWSKTLDTPVSFWDSAAVEKRCIRAENPMICMAVATNVVMNVTVTILNGRTDTDQMMVTFRSALAESGS